MNTNRTWTKWLEKRTPNDDKTYRFRAFANILGTDMFVEWSEKQRFCGMGYAEGEYWPSNPSTWDGYRRYITNKSLEWSELTESDSTDEEDVIYHGLNLLPCPFTGKKPKVVFLPRYFGAAPYELDWIGIESYLVKSLGWKNCEEMCKVWNKRT